MEVNELNNLFDSRIKCIIDKGNDRQGSTQWRWKISPWFEVIVLYPCMGTHAGWYISGFGHTMQRGAFVEDYDTLKRMILVAIQDLNELCKVNSMKLANAEIAISLK